MMRDHDFEPSELSSTFASSASKRLTIDIERYQSYLDSADMSEADKRLFIEALWSIIMNFVDLGFGIHPLQEVCGKVGENEDCGAFLGQDRVSFQAKPEQSNDDTARGSDADPDGGLEVT